ncbi:MAG: hypothetical protein ACI8QS_003668 [Planctomycetota bacterium]|jgi:hypothetical protein
MNAPSPLDLALALVAERVGLDPKSLDKRVARVDVHQRRGVTLELSPVVGSKPDPRRWFRVREETLSELHPECDRELPLSSTLDAAEACLSWRPGRRIVVSHVDPALLQKGYRTDKDKGPLLAHQLFHAASADAKLLRTPQVRPGAEGLSALVLSRVEGQPVRVVSEAGDFFCALGEGLADTQRRLIDAPLPAHRVHDELGVLESWQHKAHLACGHLPPMWSDLSQALAEASDSVEVDSLVGIHRDLHDGQLLDADGSPGLIDFDLGCRGDACLDPANLLAHLELRLLQRFPGVTRSSVDTCSEAFLEGLGDLQGNAWPRLRFYQSSAFLRLALVYSIRPRWRHLANPLVTFAQRCLADLVHAS